MKESETKNNIQNSINSVVINEYKHNITTEIIELCCFPKRAAIIVAIIANTVGKSKNVFLIFKVNFVVIV